MEPTPPQDNNMIPPSNNAVPQENSNISQSTPPAPDTSPLTSLQPPDKPNNKKRTIIILSVIVCILLIVGGIFAFLYFSNNSNGDEPQQASSEEEQEEIVEEQEEVEISDVSLKNNLDNQIAILFNTDTVPTSATMKGIGFYDETLFQNGDISEADKIRSIIKNALELRPLNGEETNAAVAQMGLTGDNERYFRQDSPSGINGDQVVQKYQEVFGKQISKGPIPVSCGEYEYNSQFDIYFSGQIGCGGTTPFTRHYYKSLYTTDGDYAYVYISTAFMAPTFGTSPEGYGTEDLPYHVYCDVGDLKAGSVEEVVKNSKECDTIQTLEDADRFELNSSNHEKYSKYRFVFKQSEDGNYYFEKVEKL